MVDPIRDGNNWFSYVVNDPVNYVDLWGLEASCGTDETTKEEFNIEDTEAANFFGGALLFAGTSSLLDGPLPFGEVLGAFAIAVGGTIAGGMLLNEYIKYRSESKTESKAIAVPGTEPNSRRNIRIQVQRGKDTLATTGGIFAEGDGGVTKAQAYAGLVSIYNTINQTHSGLGKSTEFFHAILDISRQIKETPGINSTDGEAFDSIFLYNREEYRIDLDSYGGTNLEY